MKHNKALFSLTAVLVAGGATLLGLGAESASAPMANSHDNVSAPPVVNCASMPFRWSGASEIGYRREVNRVSFAWALPTGAVDLSGNPALTRVELPADDPGCAAQPGLAQFIRDLVAAEAETARHSCLDLKELASIVREAHPGAVGRVAVPAEADLEVVARRNPAALQGADGVALRTSLIERNQPVPRTLDLDLADAQVAAGCP